MMKKNIFRIIYVSVSSVLALVGNQISPLLKLPTVFLVLMFISLVIVLIISEMKITHRNDLNITNKSNSNNKNARFIKNNKAMIMINNMPLPIAIIVGVIVGTVSFYLFFNLDIGVLNYIYWLKDGRTFFRRSFIVLNVPIMNYELISFLISMCFCFLYYYFYRSSNVLIFAIGLGIGTGLSFILLDPVNDFLATLLFTPLYLFALSLLIQISKKKWWYTIVGFSLLAIPLIIRYYISTSNSTNTDNRPNESETQYDIDRVLLYSDGNHSIVYKKPYKRTPQLKLHLIRGDSTKVFLRVSAQDESHFEIQVTSPKYPIEIEYEARTDEHPGRPISG